MLKSRWVLPCAVLAFSCAEPPPPRAAESSSAPSTPSDPPPALTIGAPPPAPAGTPKTVPTPPLSSPNPTATNSQDAQPPPAAPPADPRTAAIRRIGEGAQSCHARHAAGIKGRLTLSVGRDDTGKVTRVVVLRARSSPELARPAFEACVIDAVKQQRLSPARDEDHELELPLIFDPPP